MNAFGVPGDLTENSGYRSSVGFMGRPCLKHEVREVDGVGLWKNLKATLTGLDYILKTIESHRKFLLIERI